MNGLFGLTVITLPDTEASKKRAAPKAFVSAKVINASTFSFVSAVLSSSLTSSLKVSVIGLALFTAVAPSTGLKATVGAVSSGCGNQSLDGVSETPKVSCIAVAPENMPVKPPGTTLLRSQPLMS